MKRAAVRGVVLGIWGVALACGARTPLGLEVEAETPSPGADAATRDGDARASTVDADRRDALPSIDAARRDVVVPDDCPDGGGTLVYLISFDGDLMSFYPPTRAVKTIGRIACPTNEQPTSMAVDRTGIAYSVFTNGTVWQLSTATAACIATSYAPNQLGFESFGMGFVATGGIDELYVSDTSGVGAPSGISRGLARMDTSTFALSFVGDFNPPQSRCELTGTGDGRLFGYCLDRASGSTINELDKNTANVIASDTLQVGNGGDAFAFAFWGGSFWLFNSPGATTTVTQYDPANKTEKVVTTIPGTIVGAGVSTCAPL